jgi:REP element-mobilizing transposase RayT
MGRRPREHRPGAVYHAYSRGNKGEVIFLDDDDRRLFLAIVADVCLKTRTRVLAYCLMSNHFHLLLEIALASLETVMRRVLCRFSRTMNRKYKRYGHVFQARYKAKLCLGDRYYRKLLPYIHHNPVEAAMVEKAVDWPWSSARQFEGPIRSSLVDVNRALSYLAAEGAEARRLYAEGMRAPDDGFEPVYDQRRYFCWRQNPMPKPAKALEALAEAVERELRVSLHINEPYVRPLDVSAGRRAFARRAVAEGYRAAQVAAFLGVSRSAVSYVLSTESGRPPP